MTGKKASPIVSERGLLTIFLGVGAAALTCSAAPQVPSFEPHADLPRPLRQQSIQSLQRYGLVHCQGSVRFEDHPVGIARFGFKEPGPRGARFEFHAGLVSSVTSTAEGQERVVFSEQPDQISDHSYRIERFDDTVRFYLDEHLASIHTRFVPEGNLPITVASEHPDQTLVVGRLAVDERPIADPDAPVAVIFPADADTTLRIAAVELARYARRLTGRRVAVGDRAPADARSVLLLLTAESSLPETFIGPARLGEVIGAVPANPDGFRTESLEARGRRHLVICGRTSRASLYGVYDYLERYCHVGFFQDGEHVPRRDLALEGIRETRAPKFEFRGLGGPSPYLALRRPWESRTRADHTAWLLKKKQNSVPLNEYARQRGLTDRTPSGQTLYVGYYPRHDVGPLQEVNPKCVLTDGFSNWRGRDYLGSFALVPDIPDAIATSRILYAKQIAAGPPPHASHLYYFAFPASECPELAEMSDPMLAASWGFMKQVDPQARLWTDTYGPPKDTVLRMSADLIVWDCTSQDNKLPNRLVTGSSYYAARGFYGKPWVDPTFLGGQTSGQDQILRVRPTCDQLPRVGRENLANRCLGMNIFSDYLACWFFEDLLAAVNWDPAELHYEDWIDDLCLRRYGVDSAPGMARSFARFLEASNKGRYIGFGRYQYDQEVPWGSDDHCWWPTLRKDWFAIVNGTWPMRALRDAVELALPEAERQRGNVLYDRYLLDAYRMMSSECFKLDLIRMHHHYFTATRHFAAGKPGDAAAHVDAFRHRAGDLDTILAALEDVLSTVEDYRCTSRDGRHRPTRDEKDRFWRGTQNAKLDFFEFVHFIYRPRLRVMVDAMSQRLERGEKTFIESKEIAPWFPGPDPWFYYPAAKDEALRKKTMAVLARFIEQDVYRPGFEGSTADACRAGLERLGAMGALEHDDMATNDLILRRYPLSDPPRRPWSHQPVRRATGISGPWAQEHFVIEPLFRGPQIVYHGPALGHWQMLREGRCELSFTYRHATDRTRPDKPDAAFVQLALKVAHPVQAAIVAGALRFNAVAGAAPHPVLAGKLVSELELEVGATDQSKPQEASTAAAPVGREAADASHRASIVFDRGRVTITVDGRVVGQRDLGPFDPELQDVCAAVIETGYPSFGEAPSVWIRDLAINGVPVELYTDNWDPWAAP